MSNTIETGQLLEQLGIKEINAGVSTGAEWFETEGAVTSSFSPIDGKEIAKSEKCDHGRL